MKTCSACGAVNQVDSKFCYSCGGKLTFEAHNTPLQSNMQNQIQANQPGIANTHSSSYYGHVPAGTLYVDPPKKNHATKWIIMGIGAIMIAMLLFILVQYTPILNSLGLSNKGAEQFMNYYNYVHVPTYRYEAEVVEQLNNTVFVSTVDWEYVYSATDTWMMTLQDVNDLYRKANITTDVLIQLNDLSIQRSSTLYNAVFSLKKAIELNDQNMIVNEFMNGIENYNNLYYQWENLMNQLVEKYDIVFN